MTSISGAIRRSSTKPRASWWSDLSDDVLVTVYSRLDAPHDHVRLAAACRSWRAAAIAARDLRPALPWLIFSNGETTKRRLYCPQDNGSIVTFSLPTEVVGKQFVGSHEGRWVAALGDNQQLVIVNLFSRVEVPLSARQRRGPICERHPWPCDIRKIIFSEPPTSSGCILAANTHSCGLSICEVGCPESGRMAKPLGGMSLIDITFCNRELYGLMAHNELVKFKIGANRNGGLVVTGDAHWMQVQGCGVPSSNRSYIVELQGKMALVARNTHGQHPMFKLFELSGEEMALYTYKWAEVINLGDYALFLGRAFSKAVYVPSGGHGAVRRNYIYTDHVIYVMITNAYGGRAFQMQDQGNDIHMIKGEKMPGCLWASKWHVGYPSRFLID
ncbi:hypothetical protein ACQ4PT_016713 [Festuca glaucescens]